jgi:hypothetical protein
MQHEPEQSCHFEQEAEKQALPELEAPPEEVRSIEQLPQVFEEEEPVMENILIPCEEEQVEVNKSLNFKLVKRRTDQDTS